MNKRRQGNIDLLRIIAMLCIISNHLINSLGIFTFRDGKMFPMLTFLYCIVLVGVNVFFLISGYFGIHNSLKKTVYFIIDVYVYSGIITGIGIITGNLRVTGNVIKLLLFPLNNYWFFLVYVLLMIFSPVLNKIIEEIEETIFFRMTLICAVVFGVWNLYIDAHIELCGGQSVFYAIMLYLLGGGIRRFSNTSEYQKIKRLGWGKVTAVSWGLNFIVVMIVYFIVGREDLVNKLFYNNNLLIVISSFGLLQLFRNIRVPEKFQYFISFLGKHTFGVYILHSSNWMATVFRNPPLQIIAEHSNTFFVLIEIISYAMIVFFVCVAIDVLKSKMVNPILEKLTSIIVNKIQIGILLIEGE